MVRTSVGTGTNKLLETSMALLQAAPEQQLNIVVLNKALFYADLFALRDLGHAITGQKYIALEKGPVVAAYDRRIVKGLEKAGLAQQLVIGMRRPMKVVQPLTEFATLDASELEIAKGIGQALSKYTSVMMSDFSHENPGWRQAWASSKAGRSPDINMLLALQQLAIDGSDSWLDEPVDAETLAAADHDEAKLTTWR
jgi:uncharacterized phage-associated protein